MTLIPDLRQTGVSTDEYTLDGVTYWSDEQLEAVLAKNVTRHYQTALVLMADGLHAQASINGTVDPEEAFTVEDVNGDVVATTSINRAGLIEFPADAEGVAPLTFTGNEYDLHAAAAEVFLAWSGAVATAYDVEMDGQSLKRSQMAERLQELAKQEAEQSASGAGAGIRSIPTVSNLAPEPAEAWPGFTEV